MYISYKFTLIIEKTNDIFKGFIQKIIKILIFFNTFNPLLSLGYYEIIKNLKIDVKYDFLIINMYNKGDK